MSHDDLDESLRLLSIGWDEKHKERANSILRKEDYTKESWEEFFTEYFNEKPFTDDLRTYLGYPVLSWLPEVYLNLQLALIGPLESNIESIISEHPGDDLGPALEVGCNLRQTLFNSHRFLNQMLNVGVIDESAKRRIYNFYRQHIETYPTLWKKTITFDTETQRYVPTIRAQIYMNLGDALPLSTTHKDEISKTIDLTESYLEIWNNHSILVIDNNGLDTNQLTVINTYLENVPATLHNLRYITVNSLLGNSGIHSQQLKQSAGVNIFETPVGALSENAFPDDVEPRVADAFSIALAHEVNHVVSAYTIDNNDNQALAARKQDLIEAAGNISMNYLRSEITDRDPDFFVTSPQEFFASISNQWFTDSEHTLQLALARWEKDYQQPINQFLFFAEIYAQEGTEVPFYTIDEEATLTRTMVPVQRDSNNHINELSVGENTYRFNLDGDGNVVEIIENPGRTHNLICYTAAAGPKVVISDIFYDGLVPVVQSDEYVEVSNKGKTPADLSDWRINAGDPKENFKFPAGTVLEPGESYLVYTNEVHPETGGFSFGSGRALWRDKGDTGTLYNAEDEQVSQYKYGDNVS